MRKPFDRDFPVTQTFGNKLYFKNAKDIEYDYYAQWGLAGHNGIDYGCPTGTPILAPHSGTVLEATFNDTYGNYVKIENEKEGSVLAHLDTIKVSIGFEVKEGDIIGLSDNTGSSTGPHLHWGYYTKPRNRGNGMDGYVDQQALINKPAYQFKYKVGDRVETNENIAVGEAPGKQNFTYGQIGIKFPAIITASSIIADGSAWYNIDQKEIGGGSGWVKAEDLDKATLYVKPAEVAKTYTEDEVAVIRRERDEALKSAKIEHDNFERVNNLYLGFKAIGYESAEAITKKLNDYDTINIGIKSQLVQVLKKNADLAKMVQNQSHEDATAIEQAFSMEKEVKKLRDHLLKIGKEVGTKPENIWDIVNHIQNIKKMAVKAFTKGTEEAKKGMEKAKKEEAKKTETVKKIAKLNGLEWLMSFLFQKEVKET